MDEYLRARQATLGTTSASWTYDGNNMLSQIAATGVQQYNYSFDVNTGNLGSRTNYLKSKTETFGYDSDNLDRLTSVTGPVNLSLGYTTNKNGNIQTKGDAGTYVYDATQPYAVDQVNNGLNISATRQDITYYSFEKVKNITEGTKTADFVYNAEQQRIRMILKTSGTATKTRWYFGGGCERELVGGVTTQYIWIGGDAYTAVAVAKKVGTGAWTVYNIFRDHLGTITHLKNGSNPADEYSFDAWGRRRDKDDWTMTLTSEPALFADRGFTAHEYLEDFKLYNMNGRLYDPVVGRFLNADPFIQDAGFTQNYNRYSYCLNNPLKYSDPSGYIKENPLPREESPYPNGGAGGSWMVNFGEPGYPGWGGIFGGDGNYGGRGSLTPHLDQARPTSDKQYTERNKKTVTAIIFIGTGSDPYQIVLGYHYSDGSSFYYSDEPTSGGVSNVAQAGVMALLGYDNLTLTGSALSKVINSPATAGLDAGLVARAMADSKYGTAAYSFRYSLGVEYGGQRAPGNMNDQLLGFWKSEYRDTWEVAGNELTWLIRHASVSGWVQVNASGGITIQHNLYDVFDLSASPGRSAAYNNASNIFGFGWHTVLGASSPTINESWMSTYP
jgi:RHS repeat-associated protein